MISFFRKIRRRLIEQSNVRTYIFYAIGEITLVMIGILLALQVNNWNEGRLVIENEKVLLGEVMEALHADSLALEALSAQMDSTFTVYTQLFRISEGTIPADSLSDTDLMRTSAAGRPVSKENYPDLASKVIDSNIKNRIFEYYQILSIWEYVIEEYNRYIEDKMRPFLGENALLVYGYHHTGPIGREGKIDHQKLIESLRRAEVQQVLFEATQKTRNYVGLYSLILNGRDELINEIRRKYEYEE